MMRYWAGSDLQLGGVESRQAAPGSHREGALPEDPTLDPIQPAREGWDYWNFRAASQGHPQEHSLRAKPFCPWDPARQGAQCVRGACHREAGSRAVTSTALGLSQP